MKSFKVFDYLTHEDDCDFEHGPLENIADQGKLMVYKHEGFWYCMDTLRDMDALNKMWNEGQALWKVW